jgi:hypothetical protein
LWYVVKVVNGSRQAHRPPVDWTRYKHRQAITMVNYTPVASTVRSVRDGQAQGAWDRVEERLIQLWLDDYERLHPTTDIVETTTAGFSYLFDIHAQRLIAAWGVSKGRHAGARDASRMAGHPLSAGPRYHRGHAIPHTLGGPTDINLVPQLGKVNVGPFRPLERRAVATVGSFYFTYWQYRNSSTQTPSGVDQGLFIPGVSPDVRHHGN